MRMGFLESNLLWNVSQNLLPTEQFARFHKSRNEASIHNSFFHPYNEIWVEASFYLYFIVVDSSCGAIFIGFRET